MGVGGAASLLRDTDWARVAATDADSVELKVLLEPDGDAVGAVAGHVRRVRRRRLYLVDTAGAWLARSGLFLRLRRLGQRRADVVVRVREPTHRGLRRPGVRVELDVLPGTVLRTEQVGRALDPAAAAAFCDGLLPAEALLSDEQLRFLHRTAPAAVPFDALSAHGPLVVERLRLRDDTWGGDGTARAFLERATFPDGGRIEELSVRCEPAEAVRAAARAGRFLDRCGLRVAQRHRTKTAAWIDRIVAAENESARS